MNTQTKAECPVCGPPVIPDYDSRWEEGPEPSEAYIAGVQAAELLGHHAIGGCKVEFCGLCYDEENYDAMIAYYEQEHAEMVAACTCGRMK